MMYRRLDRRLRVVMLIATSVATARRAGAAPPTPSGAHPRLFMTPANVAALTAKAKDPNSVAAEMTAYCQSGIDHPEYVNNRGGADGDLWPGMAVKCAFAYLTTQKAQFLTQAIKYWRTSLNDDQDIGDNLGCTANVNTNWKGFDGSTAAPPVIITVTHDTGYPMRWYGPDIALTYDWLYGAPGVDSALLAQTRTCLTNWMDYYTASGYHNDEAGSNYNAGFVVGKALAAVAIGNDGGADGHLWTQTVDDLFPNLLVGKGLAGATGDVGTAAGSMVGGDWAEGWQYGPLSVVEYAMATRALEEQGVPQPEMDAWINSLVVREIYGTVPTRDAQWAGGDFDAPQPYQDPSLNQLDAVLAGPSSDQAAAWAASLKQSQAPSISDAFIYSPFAELRDVAPQDYLAQTPEPSLWYVARGTRAVYVRTSWDTSAYWGVFTSAPAVVEDHEHFSATNFVFTRGADHLIVDPSPYGLVGTLTSNAVTADSAQVTGDYAPSQTSWSQAELLWARGSQSAVFAARGDFAKAFNFSDKKSDIPYAHREWVLMPEGEVVTIDRVRTGAASKNMYVNFHANTNGSLKLSGGVASGPVGGSTVAIHSVLLSGGSPSITQPPTVYCTLPWGSCPNVRFPVDNYGVKVPGPYAVAIHVIDGLGSAEAPALVGSLNDDNFDPAPKQNAAVIGAAVYRASKQSYVVASSAQDGAAGTTMTYGVPGASAGRHIVFDAPEDANGKSMVAAAAQGDRCVLTITAGAGLAGHPLMFTVSAAADGCMVTEDVNVSVGTVPPGGGVTGGGGSGGGGAGGGQSASGGCGCAMDDRRPSISSPSWLLLGLALAWAASRARRTRRAPGAPCPRANVSRRR